MPSRAVTCTAAPLIPPDPSLPVLREAASACRACDIGEKATQTVFGSGAATARFVFIGEAPGNDEDLAGQPFIGPAGQLFDRALEEAGIARDDAYVTNTVKHFKWEPQGKRRIHMKPNAKEITACLPWLRAELAVIQPRVVICLGATAAQALLGKDFRVTQRRGEIINTEFAPITIATVHPSSILRAPDPESRERQYQAFVADLKNIAEVLRQELPAI